MRVLVYLLMSSLHYSWAGFIKTGFYLDCKTAWLAALDISTQEVVVKGIKKLIFYLPLSGIGFYL